MKWKSHLPLLPPKRHRLEIANHCLTFDLNHGGRIIEWEMNGHQIMGHLSSDPVEHGLYPMAPWVGRVRDNSIDWHGHHREFPASYQQWALHGRVLDQPVDVVHADQKSVEFAYTVHDWFAPVVISMTWHLSPTSVRSTIAAVTDSVQPIPAQVGWHPWFVNALDSGARVVVGAESAQLAERDGYFPSGDMREVSDFGAPYDDCFRIPSRSVSLQWGSELALTIHNSHEWFVIYNGAPGLTCVEPQTSPPNTWEQSLGCPTVTTSADHPLTMSTVWEFATT